MSNTAISALTEVSSPALDAQEIPCNDAGTTKKIVLGTDLKPWIGRMLMNRSVADQAISATTAYVAGSSIAVPVGKLRAGTTFRWRIVDEGCERHTAGSTILLKIGTLGTTLGDASLPDDRHATAERGPGLDHSCYDPHDHGGAATSVFGGTLRHKPCCDRFSNIAGEIPSAGSTFDSTTANLIVGITITTTTASAWTLVQVVAEAEAL
jgi:hypothetical protein